VRSDERVGLMTNLGSMSTKGNYMFVCVCVCVCVRYSYIRVLIHLHMSSYSYICVLILGSVPVPFSMLAIHTFAQTNGSICTFVLVKQVN
jgi:hypothetical protein